MFLGIDFLIDSKGTPFVSEVNIGLPGGVFEFALAERYIYNRETTVFNLIENISQECYGKSFREYIRGSSEFDLHRKFKIWMDRAGKKPAKILPFFRLEDKWNQYNLLKDNFRVPFTEIFTGNAEQLESLSDRYGKVALKRRCGRWSKGFKIFNNNLDRKDFAELEGDNYICQQFIDSKIDDYIFSVRVNTLAGFFLCISGDLTPSYTSVWRYITPVEEGNKQKIEKKHFDILDIIEPSWEGKIWCNNQIPEYMKLNLTRDKIAITRAFLKKNTIKEIRKISSGISNLYERINPSQLPPAFFER